MIGHPVQRAWYRRHDLRPGRPTLTDPGVPELIARLAPGTRIVDLGGSDSLNLLLDDLAVVLRVNKPFVSRRQILADQELRRYLAAKGLRVAAPVAPVLRCGAVWAQLEEYVPDPTPATGIALFEAIGSLHRAMSTLHQARPRPQIRTCVSPRTLRRWLDLNRAAGKPDTADEEELIRMLRRQWVPSDRLTTHLIHNDTHPDNIRQKSGRPFYLDLGGAAPGPRIHDLAYALAYALFDHQEIGDPATFPWPEVPQFLKAYESNAGFELTDEEHRALIPYTAAVPIYYTVCGWGHRRIVDVARWLLAHPDVI